MRNRTGIRVTGILAALLIGFATQGCSATTDHGAAPPTTTADAATLKTLVPAPANTTQTFGPDTIADAGLHWKFTASGAPADAMAAYRKALQAQGWEVTTIVSSTGGGGGGATYTGTHGAAYGVFDGGGFGDTTYVSVCAWPSKPADPNCSRGN